MKTTSNNHFIFTLSNSDAVWVDAAEVSLTFAAAAAAVAKALLTVDQAPRS